MRFISRTGLLSALIAGGLVLGAPLAHAATIDVSDNFNRETTSTVGTMSDGSHSWYEREEGSTSAKIDLNSLVLYYGGSSFPYVGVSVRDVQLSDGAINVKITRNKVGNSGIATNKYAGVTYRAPSLDDAANMNSTDAYRVRIATDWSDPNDMYLYYGSTKLASANLGDEWEQVTLKIIVTGNEHKVEAFDGGGNTLLGSIDYTDNVSGRPVAGYVGLGVHWSAVFFDDFSMTGNGTLIPEPASLSFLALGGLVLLGRRGRSNP